MAVTRSMTKKASKAKSSGKPRRSKRNLKCWRRRSSAGASYTVCSGSKGEKGVYKRKGRKSKKSRKARK